MSHTLTLELDDEIYATIRRPAGTPRRYHPLRRPAGTTLFGRSAGTAHPEPGAAGAAGTTLFGYPYRHRYHPLRQSARGGQTRRGGPPPEGTSSRGRAAFRLPLEG